MKIENSVVAMTLLLDQDAYRLYYDGARWVPDTTPRRLELVCGLSCWATLVPTSTLNSYWCGSYAAF